MTDNVCCNGCKNFSPRAAGRWVIVEAKKWYEGGVTYECSECGKRYTGEELEGLYGITGFNFCPNCGAKMSKEE